MGNSLWDSLMVFTSRNRGAEQGQPWMPLAFGVKEKSSETTVTWGSRLWTPCSPASLGRGRKMPLRYVKWGKQTRCPLLRREPRSPFLYGDTLQPPPGFILGGWAHTAPHSPPVPRLKELLLSSLTRLARCPELSLGAT